MTPPSKNEPAPLQSFKTSDPGEFEERMSGIAPGLSCSPLRPRGMKMVISQVMLPDLGMFSSTLACFRVRSPERPFYGVTIPLEGVSEFLVEGSFEEISKTKVHLQLPGREFDARMGDAPFESLQLCFDRAALDALGARLQGEAGGKVSLMETLDMARPEVQSFARHALFVWSEILRGGPILTSPFIARQSVQLLGTLLVSAADSAVMNSERTSRKCPPLAVRQAEDYLMANLSNPISIADVAAAAGTSARTLSREFRRHRETTIKGFLSERRLEAANRELLAAEPGVTNVTQVALNLGFEQLGRFAADYKKAFGELPSATLTR